MLKFAIALGALLLCRIAAACTCPYHEPAGFVHADLKHLPANARGVLFLTPRSEPPLKITEKDFIITSDKQVGRLTAILSSPMPHLLRIGPAAGLKAGAHYTVRYTGTADQWAYPLSVDFTVDDLTVDTSALSYRIQLDGAPERRLLFMADSRGSCASNQPAIAQDFHYDLPAAVKPYQQAVAYFSEIHTKGKFAQRIFTKAFCGLPTFGATAYDEGRDLVQADCQSPGGATVIRGRVGFLEVEDGLQTTAPVSIDLRKAGGRACHGMGMLAETLVRGEQQRALDLVCQIQSEQPYDGMFDPNAKPKQTRKTAPPIDALRRLASHASNEQCLCIEKISRGL